MSILIGQKLVENAKIQNSKCDILSNFQTMCWTSNWKLSFWGGFVERSVVTLGLRAWVPPDVVFFFPFSSLTQLLSREKKRRPSPCLWDGEAGATTLPMQWMANRKVGITIWSDVSISNTFPPPPYIFTFLPKRAKRATFIQLNLTKSNLIYLT